MTAPATLGWWESGEAFFAAALDRVGEPDLDRPSLPPGWPRRTVVAHIARNADALVNLLTWARTGVETPMYATPQAWSAEGRTVPASEVPWMRCREAWVHAVDLDAGPGFADVPTTSSPRSSTT